MVPWSIRSATDLPPNARLREMQQHTHTDWCNSLGPTHQNPNATNVQTNAQCVPYTTHTHHSTATAGPVKFHLWIVWCGYGLR